MKIYKSLFPLIAIASVLMLTLAFANAATASDPITSSEQFPINFKVVNVCSDNFDEVIQLDGTLHVTFSSHADGNGGFHVSSHANWQGVEGTNLTTGEKYRFITRGSVTFNTQGPFPFSSNMTTHNNLVGQSTGLILITQNQFHITVNANGEISALFNHQSSECKD